MDLQLTLEKLAIALGLGLLVGLQRERVKSRIAGIRTFALIAVSGAVSALLAQEFGGWIVAAGFLALAGLLVTSYVITTPKDEQRDIGLTTEVAALLVFGIGAYVVVGHNAAAVILGGGVALLLHFKTSMHAFVEKIGESDVTAIMRFVLIALVILPALPNETYDAYDALNPHKIWFMVVLIVAINLAGYVCHKLFGEKAGVLLAGTLGGLVSSTATTVSMARQTKTAPATINIAALIIVIASTVVYGRIITEVAVAAPQSFWMMAAPLAVMMAWMLVIVAVMYLSVHREKVKVPEPNNPAELVPALLFAALYAFMLLAVAIVEEHVGHAGLYIVAFLAGLHDVDAITLSTAGSVESAFAMADNAGNDAVEAGLPAAIGWRVILFASLVNLAVKGVYAFLLGGAAMARALLLPFGAALVGGAALLFLWPT